jgi:hypothetical protein
MNAPRISFLNSLNTHKIDDKILKSTPVGMDSSLRWNGFSLFAKTELKADR